MAVRYSYGRQIQLQEKERVTAGRHSYGRQVQLPQVETITAGRYSYGRQKQLGQADTISILKLRTRYHSVLALFPGC